MIKAGIFNGDSPRSALLLSLLLSHPDVIVVKVHSDVRTDKVADAHPSLTGETFMSFTPDASADGLDVAFIVEPLEGFKTPQGVKVIDMTSGTAFGEDVAHTFGLAEWFRKEMVRGASNIVIPGPLTEAVLLSLLPLAKQMMIPENGDVQISAVVNSGDSLRINAPGLNRQRAEIAATLERVQPGVDVKQFNYSTFTGDGRPGCLAVTVLPINADLDTLYAMFEDYYADHSFTHVSRTPVRPGNVRGTNKCLIHLELTRSGRLRVSATLDPRRKGSAGSALHAMNLIFGLAERTALR